MFFSGTGGRALIWECWSTSSSRHAESTKNGTARSYQLLCFAPIERSAVPERASSFLSRNDREKLELTVIPQ